MAEIFIATAIGSVGFGMMAQCITSLTTSANGIYTLIGNISSNGSIPGITDFLKDSDIEEELKMLELLIKEINVEKNPTRTLGESLSSLKECVSAIEEKLHEVKTRMEYNKSLWLFVSFRSYGFADIVKSLKSLKLTLDTRQNSLFRILQINDYLTPLTESKYMKMIEDSEKQTSIIETINKSVNKK